MAKKILESMDGITENLDITIKVTYDPQHNTFFFQAMDADVIGCAGEASKDSNLEDSVYGNTTKRLKFSGNPSVELGRILYNLNAIPKKEDKVQNEVSKQIVDKEYTDDGDTIPDALKKLDQTEKEILGTMSDVNDYNIKNNDSFTKLANAILDAGMGEIIVKGFTWENANLPSLTESLAKEYVSSNKSFSDLYKNLKESLKKL